MNLFVLLPSHHLCQLCKTIWNGFPKVEFLNLQGVLGNFLVNILVHGKILSGTLQWRHNERNGVPNHRRLDCLLNRLFRRRSKKASKLRITGLCEGNPPVIGRFPHKRSVTREMFPFDDVIINW